MITHDFGYGPVPAHRHINPDGSEGGWVADTAKVDNTVHVGRNAKIYESAQVFRSSQIYGSARVFGLAVVIASEVFGSAKVFGRAMVFDSALVYDSAQVYELAKVFGPCRIAGSALIKSPGDFLCVGPIGSRNSYATAYRTVEGSVACVVGCWRGSPEELQDRIAAAAWRTCTKQQRDLYYEQYSAFIALAKLLNPAPSAAAEVY